MIPSNKSLAFSGHRADSFPFSFEHDNDSEGLYNEFMFHLELSILKAYATYGVTTFYTGGANGFDLIAADAVMKFRKNLDKAINDVKVGRNAEDSEDEKCENTPKIKHILVVPCSWQSNNFSPYWKNKYNQVLQISDEVVYLKNTSRHFIKRNDYMVEKADYLVCYCFEKKGGTYYTMRKAKEKGIPMHNIYTEMKKGL